MTAHMHLNLKGYSVNGSPAGPYGITPTNLIDMSAESVSVNGALVAGARPSGAIVTNIDWIDTQTPIRVAGNPLA